MGGGNLGTQRIKQTKQRAATRTHTTTKMTKTIHDGNERSEESKADERDMHRVEVSPLEVIRQTCKLAGISDLPQLMNDAGENARDERCDRTHARALSVEGGSMKMLILTLPHLVSSWKCQYRR